MESEYEYVVVGSGAGGGTVAARLAEAGRKVLVLEAGGDPRALAGGDPLDDDGNRLPDDYDVPAFHAFSSENEALKWDFFVRHYADDEQQRRDPKYCPERGGVLYPRAGTLGGCTAHNALIFVYPANSDWEYLEKLTGDSSWSPENMRRKYFERLEDCHHRTPYRLLHKLGFNPTRHGFGGWLRTELALPMAALGNRKLRHVIIDSAIAAREGTRHRLLLWAKRLWWAIVSQFDPNDWRLVADDAEGLRYVPLTTRHHRRHGTRERLRDVAQRHPLTIELDALVTRVLFDDQNRAVGVEYLKGANLYRASGKAGAESAEKRTVRAAREVILAGGAFNTPQLLMLSGIGPRDELEKHGIDVRVELPGVGRNLQDRYEVGVVNRMKDEWGVLRGAAFARGDRQYEQWRRRGGGVYGTNGAVMSLIARSSTAGKPPDLFLFALMAPFRGYYPEYSKPFGSNFRYLTWAILKAHTGNRCGTVTLRSADPRDTPEINFHYFDECGAEAAEKDLEAVVDGVELARRMTAEIADYLDEEELPGKDVASRDELKQFVKDRAWGHHASCSCQIGPREQGGVLNGDFEVYGTKGLRVVDASVFPKIPGLFIVSAVYMIGEKASDVILAAAGATNR